MDSRLNEIRLDLEEIINLEKIAQRETVKGKLAVIRSQMQQEIEKLRLATPNQNSDENSSQPKSASKPKLFTKKITTYAWDQSDKFIKIYVSGLKGVGSIPKDDVKLTFTDGHYSLNISNLNNSNYLFNVPKLSDEVKDPSVKVKTDDVVIMLRKASSGQWDVLSEKEKLEKEEKARKDDTRFKQNDDPSKGIMDLMKKMYDEGDDEMKRTIAKAWTESREKQMSGDMGI